MRILTVRQPWAWAIIHGGKDVENRVRNIAGDYRGPIAIHVAQRVAKITMAEYGVVTRAGYDPIDEPRDAGHIIGVVDLIGVHYSSDCYHASVQEARRLFREDRAAFHSLPVRNGAGGLIGRASHCSSWAQDDAHHLVLANPRPLAEPIPYKGALGLRHLDDATIARIEAQL